MENKAKVGLSSPWVVYYRKVTCLFKEDPHVKIMFDENEAAPEIKILVEGDSKADAIAQLLPEKVEFGNVTLTITVVPANQDKTDKLSLIKRAFEGNKAIFDIVELDQLGVHMDYVVFSNKVLQYYNDNMGDLNGVCSTLYQDIAEDLIGAGEGVYFCTDVGDGSEIIK